MNGKLKMLIGLGAGYVLGARAGRERYEQIVSGAKGVSRNPKVRAKAEQARVLAEEKAGLDRLSAEYALSKGLVWGFLGMTLLFGAAWIVLAVRFLGIPVARCAAFAVALVRGRVPGGLSVTGRDEVGGLAEALREMSRRFGRTFAR